MKKYFYIIIAMMLPLMTAAANYEMVTIQVNADGASIPACAFADNANRTIVLGTGINACIPHYTAGEVIVPATVNLYGINYTVDSVAPMAFRLCNKITGIKFNEGLRGIGEFAFVGCRSLSNIYLPSTVKYLAGGAFADLKSLATLHCDAATPPTWAWNDVFASKGTKAATQTDNRKHCLYVPEGSVMAYRQPAWGDSIGWSDAFAFIEETNPEDQIVEIYTKSGLRTLARVVNDGTMMSQYDGKTHFRLMRDIDISKDENAQIADWIPIGNADHPFIGVFDGNGHTITGLRINNTDQNYAGLFGKAANSTIYNLIIKDPYLNAKDYVGVLLGSANEGCVITDILVTGDNEDYIVKAKGSAGGLVGYAQELDIERCYFSGGVYSEGWCGGLVGNLNRGTMRDCGTVGHIIINNGGRCGGIVGGIYPNGSETVTFERCYSAMTHADGPSLDAQYHGGIVGYTNKSAVVRNCAYYKNGPCTSFCHNNDATVSNSRAYTSQTDMQQSNMKYLLGSENWTYFVQGYEDYPLPFSLYNTYLSRLTETDGEFIYLPLSNGQQYTIIGYTGSSSNVLVPDVFNGKDVIGIGDGVFEGNENLVNITLGENIVSIGKNAFASSGLTAIDTRNVKYIGRDAFLACYALQHVNITDKVVVMDDAIRECPALEAITKSDETNTFYAVEDGVLFNAEKKQLLVYPAAKAGVYTVPNGVITIDDEAFAYCRNLTGIVMPASLVHVGDSAFSYTERLQYIDFTPCAYMNPIVPVSRAMGVFCNMDERTIVYLPDGHGHDNATYQEDNVVIGNQAYTIHLTDNWDFNPPCSFTTSRGIDLDRAFEPVTLYHVSTHEWVILPQLATVYIPFRYDFGPDSVVEVYEPIELAGDTILFKAVENNVVEPYKPYLLIVNDVVNGIYQLGAVTLDTVTTTDVAVTDNLKYQGTTVGISNNDAAQRNAYILQSDEMWHKVAPNVPKAMIPPYRSFFHLRDGASAMKMMLAAGNHDEETTGISTIKLVDRTGDEHYYDLNGRLLPGKPGSGIYIHQGKKYVGH
jgi:hypothetical protein